MKYCYDEYAKTAVFSKSTEKEFFDLSRLYFKTQYLPHLPKEKNVNILEVGCGHGRFLSIMLEMGYLNVYGIDISQDQIQYAKDKLGLEKNVEKADALEFLQKAESRSIDLLLMLDVMEHLPVDISIQIVKEMHRVLQPGGKLIIQVPNALAPLSPYNYGDLTHYRSYTINSMRQTLLLGGFSNIHHISIPPIPHGLKSFARRVLWKVLVNPLINFYMLVSLGDRMGGIFTANFLTIVTK